MKRLCRRERENERERDRDRDRQTGFLDMQGVMVHIIPLYSIFSLVQK